MDDLVRFPLRSFSLSLNNLVWGSFEGRTGIADPVDPINCL